MILAAETKLGCLRESLSIVKRLGGSCVADKEIELVIANASRHSSRTHFDEVAGRVYLGADVKPGTGIEANARMSILACLAHELAHADRSKSGFFRPIELPDCLIDEAETSLHASFNPLLNPKDREDLIEDARDRLIQWFAERKPRDEVEP